MNGLQVHLVARPTLPEWSMELPGSLTATLLSEAREMCRHASLSKQSPCSHARHPRSAPAMQRPLLKKNAFAVFFVDGRRGLADLDLLLPALESTPLLSWPAPHPDSTPCPRRPATPVQLHAGHTVPRQRFRTTLRY